MKERNSPEKGQKKDQPTPQKPKYVEKTTSWTKLKVAATKQHDEYVNVIAKICKKDKKTKLPDGYTRVLIADESGSMWAHFNGEVDEKEIYELDNMMVCKVKNQDGKTFQTILTQDKLSEAKVYLEGDKFSHKMQPVGEKE